MRLTLEGAIIRRCPPLIHVPSTAEQAVLPPSAPQTIDNEGGSVKHHKLESLVDSVNANVAGEVAMITSRWSPQESAPPAARCSALDLYQVMDAGKLVDFANA